MKFTNNHGLPEPLYQAIVRETYIKEGHISATSLVKPPQMVYLEAQHDGDIEIDAADQIWLLLGNCIHDLLERAGD